MIVAALGVLGLCLGSFVNALVWRLHEQEEHPAKAKALSVVSGRSMCPHCRHELAAKDLLPVLSWLYLQGKCRYCGKRISVQYPVVELAMAAAFIASYLWWPHSFDVRQTVLLGLWLVLVAGLAALLVYDLRWFILPNRLIYPLAVAAAAFAAVNITAATAPVKSLVSLFLAVVIGGGIFYVIFQLSAGKWIGGGDVKLGWLLGLIAGTPAKAVLFIFLASILGTLVSLPLVATGRLGRRSNIPFGPFLIAGTFITVLFGSHIITWYKTLVGLS